MRVPMYVPITTCIAICHYTKIRQSFRRVKRGIDDCKYHKYIEKNRKPSSMVNF